MATYEQRKDGSVTGVVTVDEAVLKSDPDTVVKLRGPKGAQVPATPEGYDHITTLEGDTDAMVSDCSVHVFAKKGSYRKEVPTGLAALRTPPKPAEAAK